MVISLPLRGKFESLAGPIYQPGACTVLAGHPLSSGCWVVEGRPVWADLQLFQPLFLRGGPPVRPSSWLFRQGVSGRIRARDQSFSLPISMVTNTVSYLIGRLPLAERAAVRSGPGGGLAPYCPAPLEAQGETVPETPKGLRFWVRMRSVDDWPLAKILFRFPGVSSGR